MTAYDYKSVGLTRRQHLEDYKMKTRRDDYMYLSKHPEIDAMIELILRKLMTELPCNPVKAIAEFFCLKSTTYDEHTKKIDQEREKIVRYRKSKSKEFFLPKPEPVATIRKLHLGPLADILEFSKPQEEEPAELNSNTEPLLNELLTETESADEFNPFSDEEEELYPDSYETTNFFEGQGLPNVDIFGEETDADGNLLNQDSYPMNWNLNQSQTFGPGLAQPSDYEFLSVDAVDDSNT
ncbi:unnamed protein product [Allacma fusca]|uniref:Uncharacterized protein n=1 Tax=Allacma fusca TaxID=39272 RepID=A0A8J2JIB7_9HEXA|nr:unnamed protein product [Allacma fusca]